MRRLIVVSGAGLSTESGIRTFRTDTESGTPMWDEYKISEVCDIHAFNAGFRVFCGDDQLGDLGVDRYGKDLYTKTHEFYGKRRAELATVQPNVAHLRIAEWYARYPGQVINITTNVDNLLERAGIPNEDIVHVHGYIPEVVVKDAFTQLSSIEDVGYAEIDINDYDHVKPNVVFFGEHAPLYSKMHEVFDSLSTQDMVIVVGASNQVINFNWELFPALNIGTKMVVINPDINYSEQELYKERGVVVLRTGAVDAFSNQNLISAVEGHLEGAVNVRNPSYQ